MVSRSFYVEKTHLPAWVASLTLLGSLAIAVSSHAAVPLPPLAAANAGSSSGLSNIDSYPRLRLPGNLRPEVESGRDLGPVDDDVQLDHVLLQLRRSTGLENELAAWLGRLNDNSSTGYHRWLTPEEFGSRFGASEDDLNRVTEWLSLHGLKVRQVYPSRMLIDFSATAGQIRETFLTEIHAYEVDGVRHIANASNPAIPAGLASSIVGIVSLHDFQPHPMLVSRHPRAAFTAGSGSETAYPVTAADLAVIYNLTPLFKAGYTGKGQTIAVVEASDIHSATDWTTFRTAFGLNAYTTGALKQVHPAPAKGGTPCNAPGVASGWDEESVLDAEYASASAPGAVIEIDSCAGSRVTNGVLIALMNRINGGGTLPSIVNVSFGDCEAANGAAANAAIASVYQQAAAEGISVFSSAGDGGAASCDAGADAAKHGIGVNAYASTPYNVAVGGTDFADTYESANSAYWNKTNSAAGGSAGSYIPEIPWDDSCANPLIAAWNGFKTGYGVSGFCAWDYLTMEGYQTTIATGGGPSNCATGSPSQPHVASGACHGYAKPAWQAVTGNPADAHRDLPDVSLFAADGIWNHYFLYCNSNLNDNDGAICKTNNIAEWSEGGGTSFSTPIMAGIQALVDQKWGRQGNPNPVYYKLAAAQFSSATLKTACNSALGASSSGSCVFHDVTQGASAVNCQGLINCFGNVLSTTSLSFAPAYNAQPGWDFATGLGSVNAYNLVMSTAW